MKKLLLLPILFILFVPFIAANTSKTPTIGVAYAGHNLAGEWCGCGNPGCFCDPGEVPGGGAPQPMPDGKPAKNGTVDPTSAGFLLGLALLLWLRLRP